MTFCICIVVGFTSWFHTIEFSKNNFILSLNLRLYFLLKHDQHGSLHAMLFAFKESFQILIFNCNIFLQNRAKVR